MSRAVGTRQPGCLPQGGRVIAVSRGAMSRDAYRQPVREDCATRLPAGQFDEPLWNRTFVDHAQITVAETAGVGGRWNYHDQAGATSFGGSYHARSPAAAGTEVA